MFNITQRLIRLTTHVNRYKLQKYSVVKEVCDLHNEPSSTIFAFRAKVHEYFNHLIKCKTNQSLSGKRNVFPKNKSFASDVSCIDPLGSLEYTISNEENISIVDEQCCEALSLMSYGDILRTLNRLLKRTFGPNKSTSFVIADMKFYTTSMYILKRALLEGALNNNEMIQFLYFLSWKERRGTSDVNLLLNRLPDINTLSLMEQCIIAESSVKAAVEIKEKHITCFNAIIERAPESLFSNMELLIILLKVRNFYRIHNPVDLSNLSIQLIHHATRLRLPVISHVLQTYAIPYIYDQALTKRLVSDLTEHLYELNSIGSNRKEKSYTKSQLFVQVTSILSYLSRLNYKFEVDEKAQIVEYINNSFAICIQNPEKVVHVLFSLWVLDIKLDQKLVDCIELNVFDSIIKGKNYKVQRKLQLLMNCAKIEAPHVYIPHNLLMYTEKVNNIFENIATVHKIVRNISKRLQLYNVQIICPLGIFVYGVSFQGPKQRHIHIDVLDDKTCLRNSKIPQGLFQLKLRLLNKLGIHCIQVDGDKCSADMVTAFVHVEECISQALSLD